MPEPKRPLKVFLCYAHADKPKVRELYRYLKRRGINPWFDEEHLVGGQDWQVEIPKALATSDAIVICLTKNSIDREGYIQKEIKFALDKALEMPEGRIFLIPVKFEECEVPFTLSRYQWVDLTVESGYAKMIKALKFRASQLERSTVEISKNDVEEENLVREKIAKETAEKAHLKEEEEERRRVASEEERVAAQKIAREKLQKEIDKVTKDVQRKYKREIFISRTRNKLNLFFLYFRYYIFPAILLLGIAVGVFYVWKPFLERNLFPTPTSQITTETVTLSSTPVMTFTSTSTPLPSEITDAKGAQMVLVPAGNFIMGSNTGGSDEQPVHTVYINSFYIDKYEVTNFLYKACVTAEICNPPKDTTSSFTRSSYYGNLKFDNYPVIYVDWNMAKTYCEWRGARLPTEAEWEKAARGTDGRTYPWGNERLDCSRANYAACGQNTKAVGSYEGGRSPYGVYDMVGNVIEWVNDWYSPTYYQSSPSSNPLGPDLGQYHVLRGGSWNYAEGIIGAALQASARYFYYDPAYHNFDTGFRCSRSP